MNIKQQLKLLLSYLLPIVLGIFIFWFFNYGSNTVTYLKMSFDEFLLFNVDKNTHINDIDCQNYLRSLDIPYELQCFDGDVLKTQEIIAPFKKQKIGILDFADSKLKVDGQRKFVLNFGEDNYTAYRLMGVYRYSKDVGILFILDNRLSSLSFGDGGPTQVIWAFAIHKNKKFNVDGGLVWSEESIDIPWDVTTLRYFDEYERRQRFGSLQDFDYHFFDKRLTETKIQRNIDSIFDNSALTQENHIEGRKTFYRLDNKSKAFIEQK